MEWEFNDCGAWLTAGIITQQQDTKKMSNTKHNWQADLLEQAEIKFCS